MAVLREDLLRFIEGHARANEIIFEERKHRLPSLTLKQAREEYDDLCGVWYDQAPVRMPEALEDLEIEFKVLLRNRLNQASSRPPVQ